MHECSRVCIPLSDIIPALWLSKKVDPCKGRSFKINFKPVCACVCVGMWVCACVWPPGECERANSALRRRSGGITGRNDGKIWEHSLIHSHARLLLRTGECVFVQCAPCVCVCVSGCYLIKRHIPFFHFMLIQSWWAHAHKDGWLSSERYPIFTAKLKGNFKAFLLCMNQQCRSTVNRNLRWHHLRHPPRSLFFVQGLSTWKDD